MMSCPYGIPRYDWDKTVPYIRKCILCYPRLKEGKQPACTEVCPTEATVFGKRDDLIARAHLKLRDNPGRYINKVWGEHEVGGTSVLYISDIDLSFLSYQSDLGTKPLPKTTSFAMDSVPFAFAGMGAAMLGLNWIVQRRIKLMAKRDKTEDRDEKG
jgi:formate dehydrogenase iron-sulfur subunit